MSEGESTRRALGWMLSVFGVLWLLVTGGCTLFSFYLIIGLSQVQGGGLKTASDFVALLVLVLIALVFIAPGIGLLWGGRVLRRR
jgi:hypothetical protein